MPHMMFRYNRIIRDAWYEWCREVPAEELLRKRTGGVGGILHTLFHIADVEWSWIRVLEGKPDFQESFDGYNSLERVMELDAVFRPDVDRFLSDWDPAMGENQLEDQLPDGSMRYCTWNEVLTHMIAHEIHHCGQLSVWAREIGRKPVGAGAIGLGLGMESRS